MLLDTMLWGMPDSSDDGGRKLIVRDDGIEQLGIAVRLRLIDGAQGKGVGAIDAAVAAVPIAIGGIFDHAIAVIVADLGGIGDRMSPSVVGMH